MRTLYWLSTATLITALSIGAMHTAYLMGYDYAEKHWEKPHD